jgi:NADH:ubiquinone reductase (H+-translocating)
MAKNIVIAGAGYGGLRTALSLSSYLRNHRLSKDYKIILVDRSPHHIFTPLLYKLAASKGYPEEALIYPIKGIVEPHGIQFIEDEVREMDLTNGDVHLGKGEELESDYLVLAPGSETNYFNIEGLKENSLPLKTLQNARAIRDRLNSLPASAHILVGGGGPTGIELAAEIRQAHGFKVSLVEAAPTLLPGFNSRVLAVAAKRLAKLGVQVFTSTMIAKADPTSITTKEGQQISFDLLIWTGGVKPPAWIADLPLKVEERGRIEAASGMQCLPRSEDLEFAPMVYALGDAVCVYGKDGKPMPGMARTAIQQGKVVAKNILADILNSRHETYQPIRYPYVMPVGGNYAAGIVGPFLLRGFPAAVFKELVMLDYLLTIFPISKALRAWAKS